MKEAEAPAPPHATPVRGKLLQRKCACGGSPGPSGECAECQKKKQLGVQRKTERAAPGLAPPIVHDVLRSPGRPLEPEVRSSMENRFSHDFGRVRVHADEQAAESAQAVGALAYTVGEKVVFGPGRYAPATHDGRLLLGHELTHVVQQAGQGSGIPAHLPVEAPESAWEREADGMAEALGAPHGGSLAMHRRAPAGLYRKAKGGFSEEELQAYLGGLDRRSSIEDHGDSDDKARAIIEEWSWGMSPYELTTRRKFLLIREMQSGDTGDEDENAILQLLDSTDDSELLVLFGPSGIGAENLRSDFDGAEDDRLLDFFRRRFVGGYEAVRSGRLEIRQRGLYVPGSSAAVAEARKRLEILYKYEAEWTERERRRNRAGLDIETYAKQRRGMDLDPAGFIKGQGEPGRISRINRRPLSIDVTEDQVIFRVRFHVRFEGAQGTSDFSELRARLSTGIQEVWNQNLGQGMFAGRQFGLLPEVAPAPPVRDQNFWLITVRPTDKSEIHYPGCPGFQANAEVPVAVTDAMCDGGVVSIPPSFWKNSFVLAHELLHLFGLDDRYLMLGEPSPNAPAAVRTAPTRDTGGRPDPLGNQPGKIIIEDLSLLFDRLGVYGQEEGRALDALREMESQGLSINAVRGEIHRLEEIVRRGGQQPTLMQPRQDFFDATVRPAENL